MPAVSTISTIERSVISAPVLTSTTNARVALAEGVHCGQVTISGQETSSWHANGGRKSDDVHGGDAKDQFQHKQKLQNSNSQGSYFQQCPNGTSKITKGFAKRSASMNTLSKMKDACTIRLGKASDSHTCRSVFGRDKFVRLGDDCRPSSAANGRFARVRTEGRDLCRDKIRTLTGYGQMRRKDVQYPGPHSHENLREGKVSLLVDEDDTSGAAHHCTAQTHHTIVFNFEDLESSFTKGIEYLDFQLERDNPAPSPLSSPPYQGGDTSAPKLTTAHQRFGGQSSGLYPHPSSAADLSAPNLSPHPTFDKTDSDQPSMGQCASCISRCRSCRAKAGTEVYSFPYQQDLAPQEEVDKADRTVLAQRIFSRGHCNPLASHPDLTKFTEQPASKLIETTVPRHGGACRVDITNEEPDLGDLDAAPIYSPSLDSFSQYGKAAPCSAPGSTVISSRKLHAISSRTSLSGTPTRLCRHGTSYHYAAPQFDELPLTPSSIGKSYPTDQHVDDQQTRLNMAQLRGFTDRGDDHSSKVLKHKDQNMVGGVKFARNKSSGSLGLPAGLGRECQRSIMADWLEAFSNDQFF